MSNIVEIEAAIERLPEPQLDQLERWLQRLRQRRQAAASPMDVWLKQARGAARTGLSADAVLNLTRDPE